MSKMTKLLLTAALITLICLIYVNSNKLSYAFDYEIGVLKPTCTYELYKQDKSSCIYDYYKQGN